MTVSTGPLVSPADAYEIYRVCEEYDKPDIPPMVRESFLARLAHPWPGQAFEHHLGFLGGVPVGYVQIGLPEADNLDNVNVVLFVLPSHRRRGVGRALFELVVERARATGRRHVIGEVAARHPDGAAFAAALGAQPGLEEVRSRLDVRATDPARLRAQLDDAWRHATDYGLIQWTGVPPDEIIDDVARLEGSFNGEAPTGDLPWEPEKVDAEQIRQGELRRERYGWVSYHTGALLQERLVGWTMIAGSTANAVHAWQNITLVDPSHRGHRLGLLLKVANLGHVRQLRPALEVIDTFNADSNEHMLRINRALGYRAVDRATYWQRTA